MASQSVSGKIKLKHDTAANWATENPVLLAGELGLESDSGNGKFGDGTTTWNSLPYAFQRNSTKNIEFIAGTQSSATGSFTGVTVDNALYNGKTIFYYLPYAGTGAATLNLTLADGTNTTGAKNIEMCGSSVLASRFVAGSILALTYVSSRNAWVIPLSNDSSYIEITVPTSGVTSSNTYSEYPYEYSVTATGIDSTYSCSIEYLGSSYNAEYAVETLTNTIKIYFSEMISANFSCRIYLGKNYAGQAGNPLPISVVIVQSEHQTISVSSSVSQSYTFTTTGGTVPFIENVSLAASIEPENGYVAGTLNRTTATASWGDTVTFYASEATEEQHQAEEDLSVYTLVNTYTAEGLELSVVDFGSRNSTYKLSAVSVSGYGSGYLMTEIELHTDEPLSINIYNTFELTSQTASHNNGAWNMSATDLTPYKDTNEVGQRVSGIQEWCEDGVHGSQWNVLTNGLYVTKLRWLEPVSGITYAQWIDGSGNSNRCFYAGGMRFSLNSGHVINYYHRFYLGNPASE